MNNPQDRTETTIADGEGAASAVAPQLRRDRPPALKWLTAGGLGVASGVLVSGCILLILLFWPSPGRLVADQEELTWRGPEGPSQDWAKLRFVIKNPGHTPVRITSTESGCGCLEPVVDPSVIPAGGSGKVEVKARYFPVGERRVPISINTDSPTTPQFTITVRLIGGRRPPFLLRADGILCYMGDFEPSETREIVVDTIETTRDARAPTFANIPPFLKIERSEDMSRPYTTPETVVHLYKFKVSFVTAPPPGVYEDDIVVIDPWDPKHTVRLRVLTQFRPPVRVIPPLVVLRKYGPLFKATFRVEGSATFDDLRVDEAAPQLAVTPVDVPASTKVATFDVALKPQASLVDDGKWGVVLCWRPNHRITVPVVLRKEDDQ